MGASGGIVVKSPPASAGDMRDAGMIPELERSPGEGNPLQYACLGNPMDRGAWWTAVHGVTKCQTGLKRQSTHVGITYMRAIYKYLC